MAGRKPLPPSLKRQKLCIALTPSEIRQLNKLAEDFGKTTSQLIGALINREYNSWLAGDSTLVPDAMQNDKYSSAALNSPSP